ncbi:penicillin-binding protein 1C [Marinoscillum furvescens]|uniref:peptidoglycan glycosyltransferase n=1 Tax=Marinoscillum furvescens DSM 4134 TaxID=1122208 RepID=A0A3D9L1D8_MARFU|nr:penicillin-binding protein 1C [Marinoscillum furvescens]RED95307.1 penicillin-binding protein 1C [Marinoscillum furvescens DSM 4134]
MRFVLYTLLGCTLALLLYVALPIHPKISPDYSQVILARDSTFLRVFLNSDEQWCLPPTLQKTIPVKLEAALLNYEDQHFYRHPGVNPVALLRAVYLNTKHGKIVSGGSTLTMQLGRMIRNKPRTIFQKIQEILLAFHLEIYYSKDELLAMYLNHAPFGSNVRGYLAASYRFFDKPPHQLSWAEASTLAILPNAPGMIFPGQAQKKLLAKRNQLLSRLYEKGTISKETMELSILEPAPEEVTPFPLAAPHLTEHIHQYNHLPIVRTTLDADLQREANFFVKQHSSRLQESGIDNACALIIHNETGEIRSYVGSQDFNDLSKSGRVDGILASRSSGSILKPFLYAMAIDEGHILPNTLIHDLPTYFQSFSPNNASERFSGIVPAATALVHSLNIPAVRLLNAVGLHKFYTNLKLAGVQSLFRPADEYGLPIILGGAEVTPWDMGRLFRGMAIGGTFPNIHYSITDLENRAPKVLSTAASYLILDQLQELIRPGLEFYWKKYGNQRKIAWKTGTSYGHKDAWAIGSTPDWTIVVWVGNFDGSSNKNLSGMRSAGPLLFNLLQLLPEDKNPWFEVPLQESVLVKTCKTSGFYATANCPDTLSIAPKHMKPMSVCSFHEKIWVTDDERYQVCSHCWSHDRVAKEMLNYPPDVNYYLRKNGGLASYTPPHNPKCPTRQAGSLLKILYPSQNSNIFVPQDFDGTKQAVIGRVAHQHVSKKLYWYMDNELIGKTERSPTLPLQLTKGSHILSVTDTEGNRDEVHFSVKTR